MPELPKKRSLRRIETYFEIRFSRLSSQGEAGGVGGEVLGWDEDGGGVWRIWSAPGAYAKGYRRGYLSGLCERRHRFSLNDPS
jgi:hypothetical protein